MTISKPVKAWYFAPPDKKLRYGDNRLIRVGTTHKVKGAPALCRRGLHASLSPLDALYYAKSSLIFRVELSGEIERGYDKLCATERRYIFKIELDAILRKFARMCALDVLHLWDAPDVVRQYLKTGDESLRAAARSAARDAAWAAAWAAARSAARDAAWAAAWAATRASAWTDARDAAWAAAWAATRASAWTDAWAAAWDAAWAAAWDDAKKKQAARLRRLIAAECKRLGLAEK